jgi:hypothetical protein
LALTQVIRSLGASTPTASYSGTRNAGNFSPPSALGLLQRRPRLPLRRVSSLTQTQRSVATAVATIANISASPKSTRAVVSTGRFLSVLKEHHPSCHPAPPAAAPLPSRRKASRQAVGASRPRSLSQYSAPWYAAPPAPRPPGLALSRHRDPGEFGACSRPLQPARPLWTRNLSAFSSDTSSGTGACRVTA